MLTEILSATKNAYRNLFSKLNRTLEAEEAATWDKGGYLILPGFFCTSRIDEITAFCDGLWQTAHQNGRNTVVDVFIGTPSERRLRMKDAPTEAATYPHKINDLYLESEQIRNLVLDEALSSKLRYLLGGDPMVCNTLNFLFGSQQPYHTDSLYMTPPKDLNLLATWIALEDCHPDAGPLQYYPGSHLVAPYRFSHGRMTAIDAEMKQYKDYMDREMKRLGLRAERFCPQKGDVFVWHSQLYHGGSPINKPGLTRKSLVTHYFRNGDLPCQSADIGGHRYWQVRQSQPILTEKISS